MRAWVAAWRRGAAASTPTAEPSARPTQTASTGARSWSMVSITAKAACSGPPSLSTWMTTGSSPLLSRSSSSAVTCPARASSKAPRTRTTRRCSSWERIHGLNPSSLTPSTIYLGARCNLEAFSCVYYGCGAGIAGLPRTGLDHQDDRRRRGGAGRHRHRRGHQCRRSPTLAPAAGDDGRQHLIDHRGRSAGRRRRGGDRGAAARRLGQTPARRHRHDRLPDPGRPAGPAAAPHDGGDRFPLLAGVRLAEPGRGLGTPARPAPHGSRRDGARRLCSGPDGHRAAVSAREAGWRGAERVPLRRRERLAGRCVCAGGRYRRSGWLTEGREEDDGRPFPAEGGRVPIVLVPPPHDPTDHAGPHKGLGQSPPHQDRIPQLSVGPAVMPPLPPLLNEPGLAVQGDSRRVGRPHLEGHLVGAGGGGPGDGGVEEGGSDAGTTPAGGDGHPELGHSVGSDGGAQIPDDLIPRIARADSNQDRPLRIRQPRRHGRLTKVPIERDLRAQPLPLRRNLPKNIDDLGKVLDRRRAHRPATMSGRGRKRTSAAGRPNRPRRGYRLLVDAATLEVRTSVPPATITVAP